MIMLMHHNLSDRAEKGDKRRSAYLLSLAYLTSRIIGKRGGVIMISWAFTFSFYRRK